MRYKDFKNGKPFVPTISEDKEIDYSNDIVVQSLKEKINKYNFMQDIMSASKK